VNREPAKVIQQRERDKRRRYKELVLAKPSAELVPFVLTSAGELGDTARNFVKRLVQKQVHPADDQRAYLAAIHVALRRISVALHRGNGLVLSEGAMDAVRLADRQAGAG